MTREAAPLRRDSPTAAAAFKLKLTLELPYPPSVNPGGYWRITRRGVHVTARGKEYRQKVRFLVLSQLGHSQRPLFEKAIGMEISAWLPDRRRRDLDNLLKAMLDAVGAAGVYNDDHQIEDLRICKAGVQKPGRVVVVIQELPGLRQESGV